MRILFTGASSFSGMWFVKELADAGHTVTTIFQKELNDYSGIRKNRVEIACAHSTPLWHCSFGDETFLKVLKENSWDLLCHHGADVTNYKSPSFDVEAAVANNTNNLPQVFSTLKGASVVLTGTVFEPGEGFPPEEAVSPYGLSKGLTSKLFEKAAKQHEVPFKKFVIANPFGPFEEGRFTTHLANQWLSGKTASLDYPLYVRDNIPVSLLAKAYCHFIETPSLGKLCPKGYSGSQGVFIQRFADELSNRLSIKCPLEIQEQTCFDEPKERTATDELNWQKLGWNEKKAWDDLAQYYLQTYGGNR